ncbi:Uncharacterised protein [Vibrio cholerae]|nr:Uncharacterised protein [Vibrio cholerae]
MASAGTKIGLLAEICFIPLCQNSKPFKGKAGQKYGTFW